MRWIILSVAAVLLTPGGWAEPVYEARPDSGLVILGGDIYDGAEVRLYYEDISLCIDSPHGTSVLWSAPVPEQSTLGPRGVAIVRLQVALSSLYPEKGMPRSADELTTLMEQAAQFAKTDSIVPYLDIYKVYFTEHEGSPTYWESFVRGPFPERYLEDLESFVISTEAMREGIRRHLRVLIDTLKEDLDDGCLVVLYARERRPGLQVFSSQVTPDVRGEVYALQQKRPIELWYLDEEAAEAVRGL